ncbi:MAG: hypothetical protein KZQ91_01240 [Candidatus Thiodiazotropha sp. (ex Lucinoma borealis)]|nr:hypothetical protein [Candidatus Thiodiazotropha sp. (ex Lucinoma borealis)]
MGGMGSGRHWHCGAKDSTNDYRSIDVRRWKRDGLLAPHQSFAWQWSRSGEMTASMEVRTEPDRLFLTYRHRNGTDDWKKENYPIYLDWTECNLGGERPWFICPAHSCGRRVAILYGGGIFACRHCHQLAYPSQREVDYDRAARRANKIRARLGWKQGVLNPKGWRKPKGMHWSTFERLNKEHDAFVQFSLEGIANLLNIPDY